MERLWSGEVEQRTDGDEVVRLYKEVVRLPPQTPGAPSLALVRKHLPGGATRPPVLLVHGFAQNRYSWHTSGRSMSAWLAAAGFDVWNLELRGHGRSRSDGQLGAEQFADYVADVLHAAACLPARAAWIGHSLGGAAIYGAAAVAPEASWGVIGLGGLYGFAQHNWLMRILCRSTRRIVETPGGALLQNLQVRTRMGGGLLARVYSLSDVAGYAIPLSGWWPGSIEEDLLEERLTRGFDWTSVTVWMEMSRWGAGAPFDYDPLWQQADVPLLVMLGDKDHLLTPGDGRLAFDRSPSRDKTLTILDDFRNETHWGHLDLILGRHARRHVWTPIRDWMVQRAVDAPPPAPLDEAARDTLARPTQRSRRRDALRAALLRLR
ncbi:MAG: polyhydroxyalkanoate synthase [Myxococcota bacterium]|jgi:polyhydroxyalkanoate synthase